MLRRGSLVGNLKRKVLVFPHEIFWSIWHERNRRFLEGVEMALQCFKDYFRRVSIWHKGNFCCSSFDLADFVDSFHIGCVLPL